MSYEDLYIRKGIKDKNYRFSNNNYTSDLGKTNRREVVFKVASDINNGNPNSAAQSIEYITRDTNEHEQEDFIEPENELGQKLDRDESKELAQNWKDEFNDDKRKNSRVMTHYVLSLDEKVTDKKLRDFEAATRQFLSERFGDDGYRYVFVVHNDTKHTHAHVMVNNFNRERDRKLRMDKQWFFETRLMAKEHLKQHGFEYEATLRKDRKHLDRMQLDTENELKAVNNWFDAKLKSVSKNDKHFELILSHRKALTAARISFENAPSHQEEAINFRAALQQTRAAMLEYDKYSNRTIANYQVAEVIKQSGITEKQLKASQEKKHITALTDRDLRQTARDLVRSQIALELSEGLEKSERKRMLKDITLRQKAISQHTDIDFSSMKQQMLRTKNMSKEYGQMSAVLRKEEKAIKPSDALDKSDVEKRIYRLLDSTLKSRDLIANEQSLVDERLKSLFQSYEKKGIDTTSIEKKWQTQRHLKDEIADLQKDIDKQSVSLEVAQQRINEANRKVRDVSLSRKDEIQMTKGLEARQQTIDLIANNGRDKLASELNKQHGNLKVVDSKREKGLDRKAEHQFFAMSKSYFDMKSHIMGLSPAQKETVIPGLESLKSELEKRGVDLSVIEKKRNVSYSIDRKISTMQEINTMSRARVENLNQVISFGKESREAMSKSDNNATQKREKNAAIREHVNIATAELERRKIEFERNMQSMRELSDKAFSVSQQHDASPMAVMQRRRELESLDREFDKLSKRVRADLSLAGSPAKQLAVKRDVERMQKSFGHGRGFSR